MLSYLGVAFNSQLSITAFGLSIAALLDESSREIRLPTQAPLYLEYEESYHLNLIDKHQIIMRIYTFLISVMVLVAASCDSGAPGSGGGAASDTFKVEVLDSCPTLSMLGGDFAVGQDGEQWGFQWGASIGASPSQPTPTRTIGTATWTFNKATCRRGKVYVEVDELLKGRRDSYDSTAAGTIDWIPGDSVLFTNSLEFVLSDSLRLDRYTNNVSISDDSALVDTVRSTTCSPHYGCRVRWSQVLVPGRGVVELRYVGNYSAGSPYVYESFSRKN